MDRYFSYKIAASSLQDRLRVYKETRNGMLGADYSSKFSPWLAAGFISPRLIYEEVCSSISAFVLYMN